MVEKLMMRVLYSVYGRLLGHVVFWTLSLAYLTLFFGRISNDYAFSLRFACLSLPVAIGTTYFINNELIPKYLVNKRYGKFLLYFLYTLVFSIYSEMLVLVFAFIAFAKYSYQNLGPVAGDFLFQAIGLYSIVLIGAFAKLIKVWMKSEKDRAELKSASLEAQLKLKEAELQLLKGQIHPHFLFNTLNNLYGLALEKSDKVPGSIIRLSELLDFLLYRSNKEFVPLTDEIKLMTDYMELERLRFEERLQLHMKVDIGQEVYGIAPFLLFPFVENAFKHGFLQDDNQLYLKVAVVVEQGQLRLTVKNSCSNEPQSTTNLGGVGLSNVRKRLQLLYPERHHLRIEKPEGYYIVNLSVELLHDAPEQAIV